MTDRDLITIINSIIIHGKVTPEHQQYYPIIQYNTAEELIEYFVNICDVDINLPDLDGFNPLHTAAKYGTIGTLKLLLSYPSIDVNRRSITGQTALYLACRRAPIFVEAMLSHLNINVNLCNYNSCSPLKHACENGRNSIVRELLKHPKIEVDI